MTPKTTLLKRGSAHFHRPGDRTDLFPNHFNRRWRSAMSGKFLCAEGRGPALIWGCEGYRKFNLVLGVTAARGNKNPDQSRVICLLPGVLSLPPPPLRLTLSHTHHPASPLKCETSPRQQKGWRHWPWGECERSGRGGDAKKAGRVGETVVRSERWIESKIEDRKKGRQTSLCYPCYWHGCVCLWIYSCLFVHPFLGEFLWSVIRLCPAEGEGWRGGGGGGSLQGTSFPSDRNRKDRPYQFTLQEEVPGLREDHKIRGSCEFTKKEKKPTHRRL